MFSILDKIDYSMNVHSGHHSDPHSIQWCKYAMNTCNFGSSWIMYITYFGLSTLWDLTSWESVHHNVVIIFQVRSVVQHRTSDCGRCSNGLFKRSLVVPFTEWLRLHHMAGRAQSGLYWSPRVMGHEVCWQHCQGLTSSLILTLVKWVYISHWAGLEYLLLLQFNDSACLKTQIRSLVLVSSRGIEIVVDCYQPKFKVQSIPAATCFCYKFKDVNDDPFASASLELLPHQMRLLQLIR